MSSRLRITPNGAVRSGTAHAGIAGGALHTVAVDVEQTSPGRVDQDNLGAMSLTTLK